MLILISSVLFLSACSKSSDSKEGGTEAGAAVTYATYEMIEGCTTGVQKVNGSNETELKNAFCEKLKDNSANGNCARYQREEAFKTMQCEGVWPYPTSSGYNSSSTQSYAFRVDSCNTGFHYFSSSSSERGQKAYCDTLLNDELNQNCARSKREEQYRESECKAQ